MTRLPQRTRTDVCASDLEFDAWFTGELPATRRAELMQHLSLCERCQQRQSELAAEREAYLAIQPSFSAAARRIAPVRTRPQRWLLPLAASLAAAAAVLIAFLPEPSAPTPRTKGTERIGFFVKAGAVVRRGAPGEKVHPGDQLRFTYSSPKERYLSILSLDAAGKASLYFPESARAELVPRGNDRALPSAVELDATLGVERVFALFCDTAVELTPLLQQLEQQQQLTAVGCVQPTFTLNKEVL